MYAIYGNIYHQYTPNVSIYTIHGSYGYGILPARKTHILQGYWIKKKRAMTSCDQAIAAMKIDIRIEDMIIYYHLDPTHLHTFSPRIYMYIYIYYNYNHIYNHIYIYALMTIFWYTVRKSHPMAMPTRSSTADLLGSCISVTLLRWEKKTDFEMTPASKIYVWYPWKMMV